MDRRKLHEYEQRLNSISESLPGIVYQFEIRPDGTRRFLFVSESVQSFLGITADAVLDDASALFDLVHPEDYARLRASIMQSYESLEPVGIVGRFIARDGSVVWASSRSTPERRADASVVWTGVAVDVTDQKEAERRVRDLLREKEILLREVHHRVKNDLNLVQSLLALQQAHSSNEETRHALEETISRLSVVGRVYQGLHASGDATRVSVGTVVRDLVQGLHESILPPAVELTLDVVPLETDPSFSISAGIIVNELITNSAKHAVAQKPGGRIDVRLAVTPRDELAVTVSDDGPGFDDAVLRAEAYGYGLTIVDALAEQYRGTLSLRNDGGAVAEVILPQRSR